MDNPDRACGVGGPDRRSDIRSVKRWVITGTVNPPKGVVSGRFGASVMSVAYSQLVRQWYWIYPGGEEKIAQPQMVFVEETWARENRNLCPIRTEKNLAFHQKSEQLLLF